MTQLFKQLNLLKTYAMIRFYLLMAFGIFLSSNTYSQTPDFDWAVSGGSSITSMFGTFELARTVLVDDSGNLYAIGHFEGTMNFSPTMAVPSITSSGAADIFIVKMNTNGTVVWAKNMGGSGGDRPYDATFDDQGNIYITGDFEQTADFDPGMGTSNLTSNGSRDIFVVKLDTDGNLVWAKSMGDSGLDRGWGIDVDLSGNVYTTGSFEGTVDFNPDTQVTNVFTSNGSDDIFLQKLDSNGNFQWLRQMGGTGSDEGEAVQLAPDGSIFITGTFSNTSDMNPGAADSLLVSDGSTDIFIEKLDDQGDFLWVRKLGGTNFDIASALEIDNAGNVIATGYFRDNLDFDSGNGTTSITTNGGRDIYVHKLAANGDFIWSQQIGGSDNDFSFSVRSDTARNVYITGSFEDVVDFDPGMATQNMTSTGTTGDCYILKLDESGAFVWSQQMGGTGPDSGYSVFVDDLDYVYTGGTFENTVDFDPTSGVQNRTSFGDRDFFIQRLVQCTPAPPTPLVASLPDVTATCVVNNITPPTANANCVGTVQATTNTVFPITTVGTTTVTWTYDDGLGNTSTQDQDVVISGVDVTVAVSGLTLTANATGATYQWLDCDNNNDPIQGETASSFTATVNGNYAVEVTIGNCTDTSDCQTISSVSVNELDAASFTVYPNPTRDILYVTPSVNTTYDYEVLSVEGRVIAFGTNTALEKLPIDLSNQANGVYFLKILTNEKEQDYKVIKQ